MDSRLMLPRLLAGLQVGILGGLVVLVWFLILSLWFLKAPWALLNLFSASLRQAPSFGQGLTITTWTAVAAQFVACGLLGIFIGWVLPRPSSGATLSLAGFAFGVVISLMTYEFFWRRYVPALADYVPAPGIFVTHILFGSCLAQFPRFYWRLVDEPGLPVLSPTPASETEPEQAGPVEPADEI